MMKDIFKPIIVLTCICLVVTALLAAVNLVTAPIIRAAEEEAAQQARSEVLKEAKSFEKLDVKLPDGVTEAFKGSDNSGYVFMLSQKGYGGEIKLICGIRPDGTIEAMKTLSHSETSGIGSKVVDNNTGLNQQFAGKSASNQDSDDPISGATISSKAYKAAVKSAFEAYEKVKGAK